MLLEACSRVDPERRHMLFVDGEIKLGVCAMMSLLCLTGLGMIGDGQAEDLLQTAGIYLRSTDHDKILTATRAGRFRIEDYLFLKDVVNDVQRQTGWPEHLTRSTWS